MENRFRTPVRGHNNQMKTHTHSHSHVRSLNDIFGSSVTFYCSCSCSRSLSLFLFCIQTAYTLRYIHIYNAWKHDFKYVLLHFSIVVHWCFILPDVCAYLCCCCRHNVTYFLLPNLHIIDIKRNTFFPFHLCCRLTRASTHTHVHCTLWHYNQNENANKRIQQHHCKWWLRRRQKMVLCSHSEFLWIKKNE